MSLSMFVLGWCSAECLVPGFFVRGKAPEEKNKFGSNIVKKQGEEGSSPWRREIIYLHRSYSLDYLPYEEVGDQTSITSVFKLKEVPMNLGIFNTGRLCSFIQCYCRCKERGSENGTYFCTYLKMTILFG